MIINLTCIQNELIMLFMTFRLYLTSIMGTFSDFLTVVFYQSCVPLVNKLLMLTCLALLPVAKI